MRRLQTEYAESGKLVLFDRLKVFLVAQDAAVRHTALARELNLSEGAVKVAVHRLRRRYGQLLAAEISRTLDGRTNVRRRNQCTLAALATPNGK